MLARELDRVAKRRCRPFPIRRSRRRSTETRAPPSSQLGDRDHHAGDHEHDDQDLQPKPVAGHDAKAIVPTRCPSRSAPRSRPSATPSWPSPRSCSVDEVLQQLVDSARELAGARYAALGIPDGDGGFRRFLVSGMSDGLIAAMGPLPRTHGMLGAMLESTAPYRTEDIHQDPRFRGWWPRQHPDMRSFLGVPIVAEGEVIGSFYLTEKRDGPAFGDEDQALIELLAAHASIAITNARLYERSRELSILSERNRLALELHDVVSQKLFSLVLTAEAAATQLDRDPAAARHQVERLGALAREALDELRSLIFGLRPPDLEQDGLEGALRKEVEMLRGRARCRDRADIRRAPRRQRQRRRRRGSAQPGAHADRRRGTPQRAPPRARPAHPRAAHRRAASRSATTASASSRNSPSCARATLA